MKSRVFFIIRVRVVSFLLLRANIDFLLLSSTLQLDNSYLVVITASMEGNDITADTLQKSAANSSIKQWGGFKTAGNTPIRPPSSNAILQARQRMQDVDSTSITPANKPSALSGFKTAGGRNMPSPSAVALKRAYSMWNDDNATTTTSNTSLVDVKRNRIAEPESPPIVSSSSNDTSEPLAPTTPKQPLSFQTASALINGSNSNNNSNSGRLFSRSLSSNLRSPFKSPLRHRSMNSPSKMQQQQQHKDKNEDDDLKSSQLCTPSIATRKTALFDLATKSTNRKCMRDYFGCMPHRHSVSHLSSMNVPDVVI
ncbi:hypothetical protein BDF22DRAFT_235131 [Syncephalis plumigaleata]|nr:hypothetical protein BDF22DRAFT_235131 [Syncephalis plumigaleata]